MKNIFIIGLLIFISAGLIAQEEQRKYLFTLEDCLNFAYNNSYTLQSYGLSEKSTEAGYKQAKQLRLPSVSGSLGETFSNSRSAGTAWSGNAALNADMIIYQGGNIRTQIKQSQLLTEQAQYQTKQYFNTLTLEVLQSFLNVLSSEELLKNQEALIVTTEEQMKQGEVQFNAGQILESDYLLLKAQYANDMSNITDTRIARDNSVLALKIALSMNPLDELHIIYPDTSAINLEILPALDSVLELTYEAMPDLKLGQASIKMAEVAIRSAKSSYYPSLSLSAGIGTGHNPDFKNFGNQLSNRFNQNVALNLRVPIYSNSKVKTQVFQNQIALEQSELEYKQTELSILQTVTQHYQNAVSAYTKYDATKIKESAYKKSFDAYNAMFNAGSITVVELLQQQNNYINALNDYIQSKYGYILKRKLLDVYMGTPLYM